MPALIDLRRRIRSVRNTQQITQAMKTVATAKLKKSQRLVIESRPYWHTYPQFISEIIAATKGYEHPLLVKREEYEHPLLVKREEKKIEGIIITSDKGLCGAFNSNLLEKALNFFKEKAENSELRLVLIGKKAVTFFKKQSFPYDRTYAGQTEKLTLDDLTELAQFLIELYVLEKTDAVYVVYNEFKSILAPQITIAKVLPLDIPAQNESSSFLTPDWEPYLEEIFNAFLPQYVASQIFHSFYESLAAEQAARMSLAAEQAARMMAMENASQNAEDLITDLTLILNKMRQASITKELLEIMSAVEALSGK